MKEHKDNVFLTIFTPSFNRAHTLSRTYASLRRQSCKDFLWLIVDDGSTDDTGSLVRTWQQNNNGFEIHYIYKKNGGMHTAHNTAYDNISTELNVCIDSDDALADGAVEKIHTKWMEVRDQNYAGIIGLDSDFNGKVIGTGFPNSLKDTTVCGYYAAGGRGDKKLVYRTEIIKQYPPYPIFANEKYFSLSFKYRLIDQDYRMAVLNEILCNVEYQADGSSNNMIRQYIQNPRGFAYWRKICMQYPVSRKRLLIDCIHYVSSSILAGNRGFLFETPKKTMTMIAVIPGIFLALYIKTKTNLNNQGKQYT